MEHHEPLTMTPEERRFREYMNSGEDFLKIELYRPARKWFQKALETEIDANAAREKIDICTRNILKEQKTILVIASVMVVILLLVFII